LEAAYATPTGPATCTRAPRPLDNKSDIVDNPWKARNIKGVFPTLELFTTTIDDVLDRYVEFYGRDEVIPVARTPLGNVATSSAQREPELIRAMAMKCSITVLCTAPGGFSPMDIDLCHVQRSRQFDSIINNTS